MGCMLRSDYMSKCSMFLQPEAAFNVLSELGELGCVQFIDMFPKLQLFQRNYVQEVCRYSEMERKLLFIKHEMVLLEIDIPDQKTESKARPLQDLVEFENMIDKWESDIHEMTQNEVNITKAYHELIEFHYILTYIGPLLGDSEIRNETLLSKRARSKGAGDGSTGGRLVVITGVVRRTRCYAFEMMLWRVTHSILYYKQASDDKILIDPQSRKDIRKVAFLAVCQGEAMASRIQKICAGFQVNTFPCPHTPKERMELQSQLQLRISDMKEVLDKTKYLRCKCLREMSKNFQLWIGNVRKSKAIYHTMNMFRTENCLIGECWIPDADIQKVNKVLTDCSEDLQSNVPSFASKVATREMPPTYHRVNKFTRGFQNLINAYGDSTYRELNPGVYANKLLLSKKKEKILDQLGLYTIITFPFLFAMMFGDLGHGLILVLCGSWMWKNEKAFLAQKSHNEIWNILFGGRYVILLMGWFTVFTGFVYNDLFSKPFSLQPSYWMNLFSVADMDDEHFLDIDPAGETRTPYLYGEDPTWRLAKNRIMFENSYKMKISIIVGIIHMIFGITLSFFNYRYFRRTYSIVLQFIPEILFLTLMFFWLVVLIFMKWFMYSSKATDQERNNRCAPQILILFIDMVLMTETRPANEGCKKAYMFEGQKTLQTCLVFICLMCIPVMLFGTPIYKFRLQKIRLKSAQKELLAYKSRRHQNPQTRAALAARVKACEVEFGDLMIHQAVHTIEFVLSTISHTASYLRLWALSLAHSQLSEMLWAMILSKLALRVKTLDGAIRIIPIFALWAVFTLAILVVMEGLSAFLHCLRLHWVEFMSKFYAGGGWAFQPYSFKVILSGDGEKLESGCRKH